MSDLVTEEVAAIDHHEYMGDKVYRFEDIRPEVGACSSIITRYFVENDIDIPNNVATALLYGIFMDTDNLTRGVSELDIEMFYHLYNKTDIALINDLKGNQISKLDLVDYAKAFSTVEVYDQLGFLCLDNGNDSLLGAASDIVITIAGVNVIVVYSIRDNGIKFSTRSIALIVTSSPYRMIAMWDDLFVSLNNDIGTALDGSRHLRLGYASSDSLRSLDEATGLRSLPSPALIHPWMSAGSRHPCLRRH